MSLCCCVLTGTAACKKCINNKVGCDGYGSEPMFYEDTNNIVYKILAQAKGEKQGYKHKD